MRPAQIFVFIPVLVAGCDPVWVKERTITLRMLESACISTALTGVPGVTAEKHRDEPVLYYLKRAGTSQLIASVGTSVSGGAELMVLVPPHTKTELIKGDLDSITAALERTCGA